MGQFGFKINHDERVIPVTSHVNALDCIVLIHYMQ